MCRRYRPRETVRRCESAYSDSSTPAPAPIWALRQRRRSQKRIARRVAWKCRYSCHFPDRYLCSCLLKAHRLREEIFEILAGNGTWIGCSRMIFQRAINHFWNHVVGNSHRTQSARQANVGIQHLDETSEVARLRYVQCDFQCEHFLRHVRSVETQHGRQNYSVKRSMMKSRCL